MKNLNYIPLSSAISDYLEDYDSSDSLKEDLLYKWTIDILKQINTDEQLTNKVMILDVSGYKVELPDDFKTICEVAYRQKQDDCSPKARVEKISQWVQKADDGCELEINVNCPDCHESTCVDCDKNYVEVEVDRIWELSNPQYHYLGKFSRVGHFGKGDQHSAYSNTFQLLSYKGDSKWSGLKHIPECANVHCVDCEHSYEFIGNTIETSFKEGEILISYLARKTDEHGDLMIPDHPLVLEAIGDYIIFKMMKKDYVKTKSSTDYRAYKDFQQVYEQSLMRARTKLQMPSFGDFSAWLKTNKYMKMDRAYESLIHGGSGVARRPSNKNQYR